MNILKGPQSIPHVIMVFFEDVDSCHIGLNHYNHKLNHIKLTTNHNMGFCIRLSSNTSAS